MGRSRVGGCAAAIMRLVIRRSLQRARKHAESNCRAPNLSAYLVERRMTTLVSSSVDLLTHCPRLPVILSPTCAAYGSAWEGTGQKSYCSKSKRAMKPSTVSSSKVFGWNQSEQESGARPATLLRHGKKPVPLSPSWTRRFNVDVGLNTHSICACKR